eukprot:scaffold465620_cov11-Prasinocladus_malaysianus.AAC.1
MFARVHQEEAICDVDIKSSFIMINKKGFLVCEKSHCHGTLWEFSKKVLQTARGPSQGFTSRAEVPEVLSRLIPLRSGSHCRPKTSDEKAWKSSHAALRPAASIFVLAALRDALGNCCAHEIKTSAQ